MNIVFRTDSSTIIGSGHVMRCLTLADALKKNGHHVSFISRKMPGNLNVIIQKRNFDIFELPYDKKKLLKLTNKNIYNQFLSEELDIEIKQSRELFNELKPDWIVVDHYSLDILWESAVKKDSRKIMVIDDLANRTHDCELLLDQNYYNDSSIRYYNLVPSKCRQLLGPQYALIKSEFLKIHSQRKHIGKFKFNKIQKIILFMGGADLSNMTLQVLKYMRKNSILCKYEINVIVGSINPHKIEIEKFCLKYNVPFFISPDNYHEFLTQADLVIGAGGSSVYERCISGVPSIVFSLAENQKKICQDVASIGAHIFITQIDEISNILEKLTVVKLKFLYENAINLFINYKGAEGVVNEIQSH